MPVQKRISRQGSNALTAKLITRANNIDNIETSKNNYFSVENGDANENEQQFDEFEVLTAKQKQQLHRNEYLDSLSKEQLKIEAKRRGQKTSGTKSELLQRLGYKMSLKHSQSLNNVRATASGQMKTSLSSNGSLPNNRNSADKEKLRKERDSLKLWIHPITTSKYFVLETIALFQLYKKNLLNHKKSLACLAILLSIVMALFYVPGRHQVFIDAIRMNLFFVVYWVGLGVLSSVGLGTGLHTFLLYLGPHIASVTLAAYECGSLAFPEPPYPNEIICPDDVTPGFVPSLWSIMTKVRVEAFLWGAGTALGELPPYFMAKASRLSGYDPEDAEEMAEFEELQKKKTSGEKLNFFERVKLSMERIVEKVGFFGILACASIPNPLFDLAGITCGHFLVPFWTFFGATLIGKAVIKMHIQKIVVIVAFNELLLDKAVDFIAYLPIIGKKLQEPFKSFLNNQKSKLHRGKTTKESGNLLAKIFEFFVIGMVLYFVVSIINSLAQSYHKRIHKKHNKKQRKVKE